MREIIGKLGALFFRGVFNDLRRIREDGSLTFRERRPVVESGVRVEINMVTAPAKPGLPTEFSGSCLGSKRCTSLKTSKGIPTASSLRQSIPLPLT